jgi:hypothetical protein
MPFCLSSGDLPLVDLAAPFSDERENLARDVALQAAEGLELGVAFSDAFRDVGLGLGIGPRRVIINNLQASGAGS